MPLKTGDSKRYHRSIEESPMKAIAVLLAGIVMLVNIVLWFPFYLPFLVIRLVIWTKRKYQGKVL